MNHERSSLREPLEAKLTEREREVVNVVKKYEIPLLKNAWQKWSDQTFTEGAWAGKRRGWLVCGMTTIAMSRALNWDLNIPISENADPYKTEHVRIRQDFFYDPHAPNGDLADAVDHCIVEYYSGKGQVLLIDVSGSLLFGDKRGLTGNDNLQGVTHINKFEIKDYGTALREKYHFYLQNFRNPRLREAFRNYNTAIPNEADAEGLEKWAEESRAVLANLQADIHDGDKVTSIQNSDRFGHDRSGPPLGEFIGQLIEGWTGVRDSS